jgi:hypothetical protein
MQQKFKVGDLVFANCTKRKPWPAKVTFIRKGFIFEVAFYNHNSYGLVGETDMEMVDGPTIQKYKNLYEGRTNSDEVLLMDGIGMIEQDYNRRLAIESEEVATWNGKPTTEQQARLDSRLHEEIIKVVPISNKDTSSSSDEKGDEEEFKVSAKEEGRPQGKGKRSRPRPKAKAKDDLDEEGGKKAKGKGKGRGKPKKAKPQAVPSEKGQGTRVSLRNRDNTSKLAVPPSIPQGRETAELTPTEQLNHSGSDAKDSYSSNEAVNAPKDSEQMVAEQKPADEEPQKVVSSNVLDVSDVDSDNDESKFEPSESLRDSGP